MGKKRKLHHTSSRPVSGKPKKPAQHKPELDKKSKPAQSGGPTRKKHQQQRQEAPTIPFEPHERILLIGEGDLSFATSIIEHHGCVNVTATVLEKDERELLEKYPHARKNIALIRGEALEREEEGKKDAKEKDCDDSDNGDASESQEKETNEGATDEDEDDEEHGDHDEDAEGLQDEFDGFEDDDEDGYDCYDHNYDTDTPSRKRHSLPRNNKLLFNIDATKLPPSLTRTPFTTILFNFPHVGGKSTDINRQVRHNQSLLVSFFTRALPCLRPGGSIVVTLFEGEPYTLWNIRDLGRHAGLAVEESFRFQPAAYPGYRHARTLGVVRSRRGDVGGGWRGEERAARSYVFRRKGDVKEVVGKKRKKAGDSSDDED